MKSLGLGLFLVFAMVWSAVAQTKAVSQRAAMTAMNALYRDAARNESGYPSKWTYDHGLVLKGIERVWQQTRDKQYFDFIQRNMDHFVTDDGTIRTYSIDEYNIDNILPGRNLLFLYKNTRQEKYRKAAALLREQLKTHPRTSGAASGIKRFTRRRCGLMVSTWVDLFTPSMPPRLTNMPPSTISRSSSS